MYQDAEAYLIKSAAPLLKLCQESEHGIIVFNLDKTEDDYTKKDASILMDMNFPEAGQSYQRLASFVIVRKTCTSVQFVMEWLAYLSDRRILQMMGTLWKCQMLNRSEVTVMTNLCYHCCPRSGEYQL